MTYPVGSYSDAADRQVTYAYNIQGQQRRMVDQAGNVTTTSYDLAGRETSRAVGVVTGFVSDVQRIEMAYNSRGMVSTVTQYDAQSGGTALDEVAYAYDDWGNLTNFDQDADSSFGGSTSGRWGVAYSWEKAGASTTPNLLRRVCETLPGGAGLCYGYGSSGSIDAALSRVTTLTLGTTDVAQYEYRGLSQVAGTSLPEAGHESNQYLDGSPSSYGNIDAFGRVLASEWVKSSNGAWIYHTNISYDRNSNITQVLDGVHTLQGWSAQYSMDGLNRVIAADQGLLVESGGTYSVDADWRWRKELWTLNQTGNWSSHSVGDNSGGNNELAETGTFNSANEWTARSRTTPSTSPTSDTLAYDKVGNMTESGKGEKYVYDGFGRLREVHDWVETAPSTWGWRIHAAYRYNGLGMRLTHEINVDNDADIDGSDVKTYFAYDERWRVVGTYASPTAAGPTERWVHHAAGLAGTGGSSYIDSVVLRDRDVVLSGTGSSYGGDALEERVYVLQNWRADVVATLGRTGTLIEWIQYTPYGMAVANPPGNADFNGDGGVDGGDTEAFFLAWEAGLLSADADNSGGVDGDDISAFLGYWESTQMPSAGLCMFTAIRVGYAGYQWDGSVNHDRTVSGAMAGLYHVRHRVYDPELGRWTRRDPAGYVDGASLYQYCRSRVIAYRDPLGLQGDPVWPTLTAGDNLTSRNASRVLIPGSSIAGSTGVSRVGIRPIDGYLNQGIYNLQHPDGMLPFHDEYQSKLQHEAIVFADGTAISYFPSGVTVEPGRGFLFAQEPPTALTPRSNQPAEYDDMFMRIAVYNVIIGGKYDDFRRYGNRGICWLSDDEYGNPGIDCHEFVGDVLREYAAVLRRVRGAIYLIGRLSTSIVPSLGCDCYGMGQECRDSLGRICSI